MRKLVVAALATVLTTAFAVEAFAKKRGQRILPPRPNLIVLQPERPWLRELVAIEAAVTQFDHAYPNYGGAFYCRIDPQYGWTGYGYRRVWFPYCQ
jgi:hypothetical protein